MAHFSEKFPYVFYIKTLAQRLKDTSDFYLGEYGINTSLGMLLGQINCSQENKEIINRKLLENALKITGPSVSNLLNRLENLDAINRKPCQYDNRNLNVEITDKGVDLLNDTNMALKKVDELLTEGMSNEEKIAFLTLLEKALANVENFYNNKI